MFGTVLVANRGEIAVRIIRACRSLGIRAAAIYSDADRDALHVRLADEAHHLGEAAAARSYLAVDRLLAAARAAGADAVHPGYGFLSEDPGFAHAVAGAGLAFVGPAPETIATMADKTAARRAAEGAGVPVLPGTAGPVAPAEARAAAAALGFPLVVKASFGGGGRGLRVVREAEGVEAALAEAEREARSSFGQGDVFLERFLDRPRHVEVQVFGDRHGSVIHLGDRDCSCQRRHQKLVEEAPAPALPEALRERLQAAAVALARSVGYVGAGTVEFLVDREGTSFHFLEMNTRLQVEHGVTELVTGIDLVALQLRVAAGEPLGLAQDDVAPRGHALEARILAEDPSAGFRPSAGRIAALRLPDGPWLRTDFGVEAGDAVSPFYDSLLGKVLAWGPTREVARRRLASALDELRVEGVRTNRAFLRGILDAPAFARVEHDVQWIEREPPVFAAPEEHAPAPTAPARFRPVRLETPQGMIALEVPLGDRAGAAQAARAGRGPPRVPGADPEGGSGPRAPIDGTLVALPVRVGDRVAADTIVAVVESMKMELPVTAGRAGIVTALHETVGATVTAGALLVTLAPETPP